MDENAWKTREAARFCGISPDTLLQSDCPRLVYKGKGSRNIIRWVPSEVRAWRESLRVGTPRVATPEAAAAAVPTPAPRRGRRQRRVSRSQVVGRLANGAQIVARAG